MVRFEIESYSKDSYDITKLKGLSCHKISCDLPMDVSIGALNTSFPQVAAVSSPYCSCGSLAAPQRRLGEPTA